MLINNCQIVYHHGNCLNTKKPFARPCNLCITSCPQQAVSEYKEIDSKRCTECGLCMAMCPSDGMVERSIDKLGEFITREETIVLNCPQAIAAGFEINCLGLFGEDGWKTLLLLSEQKRVEIFIGECRICSDKKACEHSVNILKGLLNQWSESTQLKLIVKPDRTEDETTMSAKGLQDKNKMYSGPREFVNSWRKKSKDKLEEWVPGITSDETYPIPSMRLWLYEALKLRQKRKVPFKALKISDKCTSCEVCTVICPQKAISSIKEGDKTKLIYEPLKCVQCNRCVETCQPKAISLDTLQLDYKHLGGKILLFEGSPRYCEKCGKQIFDHTEPPLCIVCASGEGKKGFFF